MALPNILLISLVYTHDGFPLQIKLTTLAKTFPGPYGLFNHLSATGWVKRSKRLAVLLVGWRRSSPLFAGPRMVKIAATDEVARFRPL